VPPSEYAELELFHPGSGKAIRHIERYELRRDIEILGYSWIASCAPADDGESFDEIAEDPFIEAKFAGTTVFRGIIVDDELGHSRQGTYYNFTAQDRLGYFSGSALPLDFQVEGLTIADAVQSACFAASLGKWKPTIIGSNDTNRAAVTTRRVRVQLRYPRRPGAADPHLLPGGVVEDVVPGPQPGDPIYMPHMPRPDLTIADLLGIPQWDPIMVERDLATTDGRTVLPHPGDKLGDWLRRLMKAHNVLCWEAADGSLVLTRPNYGQTTPIPLAVAAARAEGRIGKAKRVRRRGDQPTEGHCVGRVGRDGEAHVDGCAKDDALAALGYARLAINVENDLQQQQAQDAADRMMAQARLRGETYEATLYGHCAFDRIPAPDVMALVTDPRCRLPGDALYCTKATLVKGRKPGEGTATDLTFVRPGLLMAGE
jgi:prophage tail gpP-like protein